MNNFTHFNLKKKVLQGITEAGFKDPSPIQQSAIPLVLEGHDLIAQAQTGTGKTAAFAIPILNMLEQNSDIEALIITPTRELAMQISDEVFKLGRFLRTKTICIYGGQSIKRQIDLLDKKPKVMVATPGRLLDHLRNDRIKNFNPRFVVLDESDEMLDMGFLESIEEIFRFIPRVRQTLLFSATMPTPIKNLAKKILNNPKSVKIAKVDITNTDIEQKYYIINENERDDAIMRLLDFVASKKSIVFTRTKREADILAELLKSKGYKATALHGDMEQRDRRTAMSAFKENRVEILVATDVASRGLDISDVGFVFNYHLPLNPDSYVHRIGRTGRAGKKGVAITLVTPLEFKDLKRIKEQIKTNLELFTLDDSVANQSDDIFGNKRESHKNNDTEDIISAILNYQISHSALDLYPRLSAKIDSTQLACKMLSYLIDLNKSSGNARKLGRDSRKNGGESKMRDSHKKPQRFAKNSNGRRDSRQNSRKPRHSNRRDSKRDSTPF
ncbi:DEAD/DEAH box helicase [Helicobacter sp. 23-1045]